MMMQTLKFHGAAHWVILQAMDELAKKFNMDKVERTTEAPKGRSGTVTIFSENPQSLRAGVEFIQSHWLYGEYFTINPRVR